MVNAPIRLSDVAEIMRRRGEDSLLDLIGSTCFDEKDWEW
jgi:hypothetical protein